MIMLSVFDVAAYIVKEMGQVTTWKLQKLLYYSQAWSLVWDEMPLFVEEFEAWSNGPACREFYNFHKGMFLLQELPRGNPELLTDDQKSTVDAIVRAYGNKSPQWLSASTHVEDPWKDARRGLPPGRRGNSVISKESMQMYYGSLTDEDALVEEVEFCC